MSKTQTEASRGPHLPANLPRSAGGPRTRIGKRTARMNALQHGLTATTLLAEIMQPGRVDQLRAVLMQETEPVSLAERILIDEIARHAAMLELTEKAEGAVLRTGAVQMAHLAVGSAQSEAEEHDAILAAATTSEVLDRFTRYRRGHEKSLHAALGKLRELQVARRPDAELKTAKRTS